MAILNFLENKPKIDKVIEAVRIMELNSIPMLWRGLKPDNNKITLYKLSYVIEDRNTFRGENRGVLTILKELNITHPIFVHPNRDYTKNHGIPCVVILEPPYRTYQSSEVHDISARGIRILNTRNKVYSIEETKQMAQQLAATYKPININSFSRDREIIVDVKNYWVLPNIEIETYDDIINVLKTIY